MRRSLPPRKKVRVTLRAEAVDALSELTTARKQGDFLSTLILHAHQQKALIVPHVANELRTLAAQIEKLKL